MDISKNIKIAFNEADIKQIIAEFLMNKGYVVEPGDIVFETNTEVHGCGSDASVVAVFKRCKVSVKQYDPVKMTQNEVESAKRDLREFLEVGDVSVD